MVPEFTRHVGHDGVHAINRLAEAGRLGEVMGGFAAGGVPGEKALRQLGIDTVWKKAKELIGWIQTPGDLGGGGSFASNGQWGPANYNGFAANTAAAKAYIEQHFSGVASIGGLYGGSVPGSDHPAGKALDVMIANYSSQAGIAAGNAIADWFQNNPSAFGTKYEIWRKQYREPGQPWGPYSHPSGSNDTLDHFDHVHLSFLTGAGQFAGTAGPPKGDVGVGSSIAALAQHGGGQARHLRRQQCHPGRRRRRPVGAVDEQGHSRKAGQ